MIEKRCRGKKIAKIFNVFSREKLEELSTKTSIIQSDILSSSPETFSGRDRKKIFENLQLSKVSFSLVPVVQSNCKGGRKKSKMHKFENCNRERKKRHPSFETLDKTFSHLLAMQKISAFREKKMNGEKMPHENMNNSVLQTRFFREKIHSFLCEGGH